MSAMSCRASILHISVGYLALPWLSHACDAGVYWGINCTSPKGSGPVDPACNGYPLGAGATSSSSTLIWEKGGKGSGGMDNLGGDVFLSTFIGVGCGGGYYGSQMHFNSSALNLDWAIWDVGTSKNTHPINPVDEEGRAVRNGKLCSTHEPPPAGYVACRCSRYSGEGFGTHCGLSPLDNFSWEIGAPYTLNITLDSSYQNNASDATFRFTLLNEKSQELVEVGRIRTTKPPSTPDQYELPEVLRKRVPLSSGLQSSREKGALTWAAVAGQDFHCDRILVGGGSFQEFYTGGNFTSWATVSGPRFRGVEGLTHDIVPTGFQACAFFGNCSGGYGGCHNETTFYSKGAGADDCSKSPVPAEATCGHEGLPSVSFKGGPGQPVAEYFVPPWYHWAPTYNGDGTAGPDGGTLPQSGYCDYAFDTSRDGGSNTFATWASIPYPGSQPYSMPQQCANETSDRGFIGPCSRLCCAYCVADDACVEAKLAGNACHLVRADAKVPFTPWNNRSHGITTVFPRRQLEIVV